MKIRVALELRQKSNAEILIAATHYANNMKSNSLFAAADIVTQVDATVTAITNLTHALNLPVSETKADQVRGAREMLDWNLNVLASKVEAVASNPAIPEDQRAGIVHSAGMDVRSKTTRAKRVFAVANGDAEGTVELKAEAGPAAHEWQYTKDVVNFTNRVAARTTVASHTTISGLESLVKYAFFHKAVVSDDEDAQWEGPLMITVH